MGRCGVLVASTNEERTTHAKGRSINDGDERR